ncbi:hypothetical protein SBA5_10057 [Candidatus Sulfotelmatomonas gaucii]|uniref:Uncharacterized protein n=1 Tax=Candidatus Sulfuritelmatomonas gaucii TaxID=2043161 RepID=A0A2N9L2E0_9BACT|nr:hypothetical protein SBA5_10057 [Candidatus Sulfotelmatomonas gaucii]
MPISRCLASTDCTCCPDGATPRAKRPHATTQSACPATISSTWERATLPAASRAESPSTSTPTTSPTSATGLIQGPASATRSFGSALHQPCVSTRTTLFSCQLLAFSLRRDKLDQFGMREKHEASS